MPRIFVGNFDFENELTARPRSLSHVARERTADLVSVWVSVAAADDLIWSPGGPTTFDFAQLRQLGWPLPRFVAEAKDLPRGPDWHLTPWGWTESLLKWGESFGWTCDAPTLDAVRRVNSRAFRFQLEQELHVALPTAGVFQSEEELLAHIGRSHDRRPDVTERWVIKSNYGMAGRERLLRSGPRIDEKDRNWISRRIRLHGAVVYEPWLNRSLEAGIQWQIPRTGEPQLIGIAPLTTLPGGGYAGSEVYPADEQIPSGIVDHDLRPILPQIPGASEPSLHESGPHQSGPHESGPHEPGPHEPGPHEPGPHEPGPRESGSHVADPQVTREKRPGSVWTVPTSDRPWGSAVEVSREVARRVQQEGYWGPMGIDAMVYLAELPGNRQSFCCRPLQDLNARFTMGRLALGWRSLIPAGMVGHWLHQPRWPLNLHEYGPDDQLLETTAHSGLLLTRQDRPQKS